jgi:methionine aminopeptidase
VSARNGKVAADIVNVAVKKLVELSVEGANVLDLCVEGDKLIEEGTSAVYNKSVKGVKVSKGSSCAIFCLSCKKTPPYVPYNGRLID